jgi:hypothetical protein
MSGTMNHFESTPRCTLNRYVLPDCKDYKGDVVHNAVYGFHTSGS